MSERKRGEGRPSRNFDGRRTAPPLLAGLALFVLFGWLAASAAPAQAQDLVAVVKEQSAADRDA